MREEGGREAEKERKQRRKREWGREKEKKKRKKKLSIKVGGVLISPQKPSRPTHGSKREKGKGKRVKEEEENLCAVTFQHSQHFQPLQKWLWPLTSHPQSKLPSIKPFSSPPPHARRESDVPSVHKRFPACDIKRKLHTLSVSSAEAENLVPRHFTLNVETTQWIKWGSRWVSARLFVWNARAPREFLCFLELAKGGLFFQHFEVVRLNV